jgi:iron complex outermembrane receptor protein
VLGCVALPAGAGAQDAATAPDSLATLRVRVERVARDTLPVEGAIVRAGRVARQTGRDGLAVLRLAAGTHAILVARLGLAADSLVVTLRAAQDTSVVVRLGERAEEVAPVLVTATRGERRVEDTPLRVEVIDEEEIAEKVAMTPGDIAMMLNETSGLRVQATSPSLGSAGVRVQGLRGRYTLLLADGLPLHGGQGGGFGLLQVPPVDLGRVEVIKGTASALYGSAALGGVVNLVSRRPGDEAERTMLVNGTSRGGSDAVFFGAGPLAGRWGYTLLAGAHAQRRNDVDGDGWADMPGYGRGVVRPRLFWDDGAGRSAFLTAGFTAEDRTGGTLPGRRTPAGTPFPEGLETRRGDVGGLARMVLGEGSALHGGIVTLRGSAVEQRHGHRFGAAREDDHHRTMFAEAALALPREHAGRAVTYVAGAAIVHDAFRAADVAGVDYTHSVPAAFAQLDVDAARWLTLSGSARADAHNVHGTTVNPRLSLLARVPDEEGPLAGWTARLSGGTGAFAPTPLVEEVEATGLRPLIPPGRLRLERAQSASLDVGGPVEITGGRLELHATVFGSRIRDALLVRVQPEGFGGTTTRLEVVNATRPTRTWGTDLFARARLGEVAGGELGLLGTYVHLRSTEEDPVTGTRRAVPLTPRHSAGLDVIWEAEDRGRLGLEFYYTGRQSLDDDPYRAGSRPYLLAGLLAEWRVAALGGARVFVNGENLTGVRQTRWSPLVRPTPGAGGRWTTDAWTELAGATVNAGVRVSW